MSQISFELTGPSAIASGGVLTEFLKSFDPEIDVQRSAGPSLAGQVTTKVVDPIAVATLILSIPAAILAVMDLVDRIEKRRRAQKLIDEAKRLRSEKQTEVKVSVTDAPLALADLTADDLLDMVNKTTKTVD